MTDDDGRAAGMLNGEAMPRGEAAPGALLYLLGLMTHLLPAPFTLIRDDGKVLTDLLHRSEGQQNGDEWNVISCDDSLKHRLLKLTLQEGACLVLDELPVMYGGVSCGGGMCLLFGPVTNVPVDQNFCRLYALKHNAANCVLMQCEGERLAAMVLTVSAALTGSRISFRDFVDRHFMLQAPAEKKAPRLRSAVEPRPHDPRIFEESIVQAIMDGEEQHLADTLNSAYAGMRGTVGRDPVRNARNLSIVDVIIATRGGILGGISVEEMYQCADDYILRVEESRTPEEARALARDCALHCCRLVRALRQGGRDSSGLSAAVARARDYIDRHVTEKISCAALCAQLKISHSYLVKLFRREIGMTLEAYIRNRKVAEARRMLGDDSLSIAEVAEALSFSSQSRFDKVFHQEAGTTPGEYRRSIRRSVQAPLKVRPQENLTPRAKTGQSLP